jgi:hypothetical protein
MRAALTNTTPALPLIAKWRNEILQEVKVFYSTSNFMAHLDDRFKESASRLSLLGTSFFAASWYQGLEDSMKKFLHMFQRSIQYYEVACLRPSIIMRTDNDLFLLLKHQLIAIRYAPNPSALSTVSNLLNEPLRITLFIYLNMCVDFPGLPSHAIHGEFHTTKPALHRTNSSPDTHQTIGSRCTLLDPIHRQYGITGP